MLKAVFVYFHVQNRTFESKCEEFEFIAVTYVSITDTIRRRRFFPIQCEVGLNTSILFAVEIAAIQ